MDINVSNFSMQTKVMIYSIAAVILTIGMRDIATILIPIFFSVFIFLIFAPLIYWLKRKGIPGGVSIGLVILFFIMVFTGTGVLLMEFLPQFTSQIPDYQIQLTESMESLAGYLPVGMPLEGFLPDIGVFIVGLTAGLLTTILNAGTTVGLIIITTIFLLLDIAVPGKIRKEAKKHPFLLSRTNDLGSKLVDYIVIRTGINLVGGIGAALILFIGGIDFAILWGILTFILGYIPYIGFFLAVLPPTLLGLFKYGIAGAMAVFVAIWLLNLLIENILFPSVAGKGFELPPSIIFISLMYWTYVLGTPGALIAVPLTMVVKMVIESSGDMRWRTELRESEKED
ncbi:Putative transport protein [Methanosarcina horonobensis HB-1 = JCM 15518]|uniref:Putative transport protein n=2 Tax=Methanosarcina horonobensis TaxID=418008 RepID=A0A0E3SF86_9EURY|nr:AI-2E family transporter [Methanosarcina horonobensis]AKB78138.1 Putative transport protein [Methanosarcina horonobensis HB-1 = JCM 15518]